MPTLQPLAGHGSYYIWKYVPNLGANIFFIILWLLITILLSWRVWKLRAWFSIIFIIGCILEIIGYAARACSTYNTGKLMPYIIQSCFILVPPAFFAATIYMCFGRLIRYCQAEHLSIIRPTILTRVFVAGDVISFLVQASSSSFLVLGSTNPVFPKIGEALVLTGLAIQLISFGVFCVTILALHLRIRKIAFKFNRLQIANRIHCLRMLYTTSTLVIVRSTFRIIEYALGQNGYALSNEWTLYVFDTVPMFAVALIFYLMFPTYLVGVNSKAAYEIESDEGHGVYLRPITSRKL